MNSQSNFINKLVYFGVAINRQLPKDFLCAYHDLEEFFVEATLHLGDSSRVARGILSWVEKYGYLLSPSKLRRLIKAEELKYDPATLGAFLSIIKTHNVLRKNWELLEAFTKVRENPRQLFSGPRVRRPNPDLLRYGIIAPLWPLDESKYLLPVKKILKNSIELKYRTMGVSQVPADLLSLLSKEKDAVLNLSQAAKRIFSFRSNVNMYYRMMKLTEQLG